MQIRTELATAGLDPGSVQMLADTHDALKEAMKKEDEQTRARNNGRGGGGGSKAGKAALYLWDKLLMVLKLMYEGIGQSEGPDEACDFRLVVQKWVERKAFGGRGKGRCAASLCLNGLQQRGFLLSCKLKPA
jgi:hypothetical protein